MPLNPPARRSRNSRPVSVLIGGTCNRMRQQLCLRNCILAINANPAWHDFLRRIRESSLLRSAERPPKLIGKQARDQAINANRFLSRASAGLVDWDNEQTDSRRPVTRGIQHCLDAFSESLDGRWRPMCTPTRRYGLTRSNHLAQQVGLQDLPGFGGFVVILHLDLPARSRCSQHRKSENETPLISKSQLWESRNLHISQLFLPLRYPIEVG